MSAKKARGVFHLSLFVLVAGVPTTDRHTITPNSVCAKEAQNESPHDRPLVEVTLRLEGKTLPGKPRVVPASATFAALYEKSGTPLDLQKVAENIWKCHAVKGHEYVIGWVVRKGWFEKTSRMFGYCTMPFEARDDLTVTFSPGMPATFEYDLTNPPENVQVFPAEVSLLVETLRDGESSFLNWGGRQEISKPGVVKVEGLAGGRYLIHGESRDSQKYVSSRTPFLYDWREVEIKSGIVNRFEPVYPQVDVAVEEGDVTIRGTLYGRDKKPLADKTVRLIPYNEKGIMLDLYYPAVVTDSSGKFVFTGVRPNLPGVGIESGRANAVLGKESLRENNSVSVELVGDLKKMATEIGSLIEDVSIEWKDGTTGRLSDLTGKTVVLDVWATWCAPCVRALPKVNTLAADISERNEVVFIALSRDADHAIWKETIDKINWNALRHGWFDPKENSCVIKEPIPFYMIIDEDRIIRAQGNDIDIALELEKIAGGSGQPKPEALVPSTED